MVTKSPARLAFALGNSSCARCFRSPALWPFCLSPFAFLLHPFASAVCHRPPHVWAWLTRLLGCVLASLNFVTTNDGNYGNPSVETIASRPPSAQSPAPSTAQREPSGPRPFASIAPLLFPPAPLHCPEVPVTTANGVVPRMVFHSSMLRPSAAHACPREITSIFLSVPSSPSTSAGISVFERPRFYLDSPPTPNTLPRTAVTSSQPTTNPRQPTRSLFRSAY